MQNRSFWGFLMTRSPPTKLLQMLGSAAGALGVGSVALASYAFYQERNRVRASILDQDVTDCIDECERVATTQNLRLRLKWLQSYQTKMSRSSWLELFSSNPLANWTERWHQRLSYGNNEAKRMALYQQQLKDFFYMVQRCHTRHPERAKWVEEFMHGPVLSEVQARVFLDVSEPMDRVRCANDVNCLWDRDRPLIYDWLRSGFSIPNSKSSSAGG